MLDFIVGGAYAYLVNWIAHIFLSIMALLSHQTPVQAVITPVPAIIEAPKGVVRGERVSDKSMIQAAVGGATEKVSGQDESSASYRPTPTTSLINPNQSFMDVHEPEGTAAPEPVLETEQVKPTYIVPPAPEEPFNGTEYSTGGY